MVAVDGVLEDDLSENLSGIGVSSFKFEHVVVEFAMILLESGCILLDSSGV